MKFLAVFTSVMMMSIVSGAVISVKNETTNVHPQSNAKASHHAHSTSKVSPTASPTPAISSVNPIVTYGTATYYTPGIGSCGWWNADTEWVVAINSAQMNNGPNPNNNPNCGTQLNVTNLNNGLTITVGVVDTCPGCGYGDLDLSDAAFQYLDSNWYFDGHFPISWEFI